MPRHRRRAIGGAISAPAPLQLAAALERELRPLQRQIRATIPSIKTKGDARRLAAALRREWSDARIRKIVERIGIKVEAIGSKTWERNGLTPERLRASKKRGRGDSRIVIVDALPNPKDYDGEVLVAAWVANAVKFITSVRDEVAEAMIADIAVAAARGESASGLAAKWVRQGIPVAFGTLEGRMKVIAQHQITSLNAKVQKTRAQAIGVDSFIWRTKGDTRVRPRHVELNGTTWKYSAPPSEGLPGTPINCRCHAESVISSELLSALGIGRLIQAA